MGVDHQKGVGAGGGYAPSRAKRGSFWYYLSIKTMLVLVLYLYVQLKIALHEKYLHRTRVRLDEQIVSGVKLLFIYY